VLHSFTGGSDGANPYASLIADKQGALYGTTHVGGSSGSGTVFKLTPPVNGQTAWKETVLYSFGGSDGAFPWAGLVADKQGALYGTTTAAGNAACDGGYGCGTVFKLTPPVNGQTAWKETVLHTFAGGGDGATPFAGLIADQQGALYGTTEQGGSSNYGTVFKLTPPAKAQTTWTETVLHSFSFSSSDLDGVYPTASLIAGEQGTLYGATPNGGSRGPYGYGNNGYGYGTVFKLTLH
jgi:uncharacterized repeat protein (TIGR03803 family)